MVTYPIPLVPGPTTVPQTILEICLTDYGSGDIEADYSSLYAETQGRLRHIFKTKNDIAIMTGEGMAALWGALKSTINPGDRVLAVATGIFGYGIGEMAQQIGADVQTIGFDYDVVADPLQVAEAIRDFRPKMVTAVHCETPSGTLNPIADIGELIRRYEVPLYYVDAVGSFGGAPLDVDAWSIDLCLGGSQKCLSAPPDMAIVTVSDRAWSVIDEVDYVGYDALKPWRTALEDKWYPYTPSWHSTASVNAACKMILEEGLEQVIDRHSRVAAHCRDRVRSCGLSLYPRRNDYASPTVTVVNVPDRIEWAVLNQRFRDQGLVVGGAFGPLAGKVFRIGHMGVQANKALVDRGLNVIEEAIKQ
ncbi:MAG TPA: alanine--glyoxylate aminotransferase family protein [candidate division Zixibacteria bacterium]|jgi:aspartate aminotransferase-like enzyme|nr:alanine--glyoxylate aminotransferase family protein [candidate division Zixibacteria bacterium]